jgi:hypothetical protein
MGAHSYIAEPEQARRQRRDGRPSGGRCTPIAGASVGREEREHGKQWSGTLRISFAAGLAAPGGARPWERAQEGAAAGRWLATWRSGCVWRGAASRKLPVTGLRVGLLMRLSHA